MFLSIIIPVYNSEKTIGDCLRAVYNSEYRDFEVILADDASTDNTVLVARKFSVKVTGSEKNSGPSAARNLGAAQARGDILVFIDSDIVIKPDTLERITGFFKKNRDYAGLSGLIDPGFARKDFIGRYKDLYMYRSYLGETGDVSCLYTSLCAVKRDAFRAVGGFDENTRVIEDTLLGVKLSAAGHKLAVDPTLKVGHLHLYDLAGLIRDEYRRSRGLIIHKLTNLFYRQITKDKRIALNYVLSLILLPLILVFLLMPLNARFVYVGLAVLTVINLPFLWFMKKFYGLSFAVRAFFLFVFDIIICDIGLIAGLYNFIRGERI